MTPKSLNVLIIGNGAREHAMAYYAELSPRVKKVFVAPGNGGTAMMDGKVSNVAIAATDINALLQFALESSVDLTVIGPEQPLELGIVDLFRKAGKKIVGPTQAAAKLETNKGYAKMFMDGNSIPTASFGIFYRAVDAMEYISAPNFKFPAVIKASGLCAGKGVFITLNREQAFKAIKDLFKDRIFGAAGDKVVIEEFLLGQEASIFALVAEEGETYKLFAAAQDHKRIGNGDTGKNTGGMGAYAPAPVVTPEVMRKVEERIIQPTLKGMRDEGSPYTGFLYIGLMIDENGDPSVVEYNARMGDPETQVVLPLLKSDFVEALWASVGGTLADAPWEMKEKTSVTAIVIAATGYPDEYETGKAVKVPGWVESFPASFLFHAGTRFEGGKILTAGGRVLSVMAIGTSLGDSIFRAYELAEVISFEGGGSYYRKDIGTKGLERK